VIEFQKVRRIIAPFVTLFKPLVRGGALAVADQGLISCVNFFTVLLVGRAVPPSLFGLFALLYTGLWMFQNVQRALIVEPMNVLGATKEADEYRSYVAGSAVLQIIFAVLMGCALLVSGVLLTSVQSLLFSFAAAVVFFQLQEFVRRIFYIRTRVSLAFLNDGISYGGRVILLTGLYTQGLLTPASAMIAIALTSGVAVAVGSWQARSDIYLIPNVHSVRNSMASNWRYGRWLLGETLLPDLAHRFNTFLLMGLAGPAAVGAFTAAFILTRITNVFIQSFDTLIPPLSTRRFKQQSQSSMEALLRVATLIGVVPVLGSLLLLTVFAEDVLHIAYDGIYDEFASVLRIVALWSLLLFLSTPIRVALKSMEEPRILFIASTVSTVFLLTGGTALVATLGIMGAAWALVLSTCISVGTMTFGYWRITRRRVSRKPQVAATDLETIRIP